jgi:menaquinone-dependent protoporphyrinogen oxidase
LPKKEVLMPSAVLVAYATTYGSTQGVAEAVAAALRDAGLTAECRPASHVQRLDDFGAVVLGAPLYMFHWHKDAKRFLERHHQTLAERPVALFALGPFNDVEKEFQDARITLDKELVPFSWLAPVAIEVFGGKFDPAALRLPYSLIPALKKMPASDIRNWPAIRAWAEDLAPKLQSGASPAS